MSKKSSDVIKDIDSKGLKTIVIGDGNYVVEQYPSKNNTLFKGDALIIKTNSKNIVMNDLTGLSMNEVRTYSNMVGIKVLTEGYGYVETQSIEVGKKLSSSDVLKVVFK